jgi:hypothetical protein
LRLLLANPQEYHGLFADEDFSDILTGLCQAEFSAETEI